MYEDTLLSPWSHLTPAFLPLFIRIEYYHTRQRLAVILVMAVMVEEMTQVVGMEVDFLSTMVRVSRTYRLHIAVVTVIHQVIRHRVVLILEVLHATMVAPVDRNVNRATQDHLDLQDHLVPLV